MHKLSDHTARCKHLSPVIQRADNGLQWINRYPADNCQQNVLGYPPDRDLFSGYCYPTLKQPGLGSLFLPLSHIPFKFSPFINFSLYSVFSELFVSSQQSLPSVKAPLVQFGNTRPNHQTLRSKYATGSNDLLYSYKQLPKNLTRGYTF